MGYDILIVSQRTSFYVWGTAMKNTQKSRFFYTMMAGFGAISLSVAFFFVLYHFPRILEKLDEVMNILAPFVYGGVVAYLLRPMCNWYEDILSDLLPRKMRKMAGTVAVTLSMISGLLIIYALIIMIAPQLYTSIMNLWKSLPEKVETFISWVQITFGENEELVDYLQNAYLSVHTEIETWVKDTLLPQLSGVINIVSGVGQGVLKVGRFFLDLFIGLIVAVYLLSSRKRFKKQSVMLIRSVLNPRWADIVLKEIAFIDKMFGGFIDGKLVDSAIIGLLCYIGCSIFKFPNALLVSAIVGITNVIPFFGPFIGAVPATILILLEDPIKGLWFIVFVFALQQLDGNIIGPKILGDRTGLSSFWVLFGIILFGGLWGLVGMVIAVPLVAVIYDLVKKFVHKGLKKNDCIEVWDEYNRVYGEEKIIQPPVIDSEKEENPDLPQ